MKGRIRGGVESDAVSGAIGLLNNVGNSKAKQRTKVMGADWKALRSHLDLSQVHSPIGHAESSSLQKHTLCCMFQS